MKRIVILCDGTWNAAEAAYPTNVVRLGQALAPTAADGTIQVPVYVEGVGTGRRGVTRLSRGLDRFLGGALGLGLLENVVEAYRHLVFLHEPGDEVFIFGFSRGAFTARSLAGLIRFTGLLSRGRLSDLPEAVARYSERRIETAVRRQTRNAEWRALHAPDYLVDPADEDVYTELGADKYVPFDIAYLGVWDTVGALGVPGFLTAAPIINRKYAFHDAALGSIVQAARHAVALDERRTAFRPTLWTNLDALNEAARTEGRAERPYREAHFAGDHGSVGGGGELTGLSALALLWVIVGAQVAGLEFDDLVLKTIRKECDPMGPLTNSRVPAGGWFAALMRRFGGPRDAVARFADVSDPARERWAFEAKTPGFAPYRPEPLGPLEAELAAWRDGRTVT